MKNTSDIVGMLAFPFQTEIAFVVAIFTTAQRLVVSAGPHLPEAILERLSLRPASCGLCGTYCRGGLGCSALA
jgi:hypothetical protein